MGETTIIMKHEPKGVWVEEWSVRPAYTAQRISSLFIYLAGDGGDVVSTASSFWNLESNTTGKESKTKQTNQKTIQKHVYEFHEHPREGLPWWSSGLRIHPPMQGTQVQFLVQEDSTCFRATKPVPHSYGACSLEPLLHNERSYCSEKPPHRTGRSPPPATTRESPGAAMKTQPRQKKQRNK